MHVQVDKVIAACRELGIRCIVAPFEADAQLAYLSRTNQIVRFPRTFFPCIICYPLLNAARSRAVCMLGAFYNI